LFRPGMSVTAEIETRLRTNVLSVPIASVTARLPKIQPGGKGDPAKTNSVAAGTNAPAANSPAMTNSPGNTELAKDKKAKDTPKQVDVVFVVEGDRAKMIPVKIGISDDNYYEVTDGLQEGQEVISGGWHAISHDLEDGKRIVKGKGTPEAEKKAL